MVKKFRAGFTLIEILIVMLILVITIGVIGLSVTSLQVRNELQPFIDRLYQRMNFYGQDAIFRQSEIGLSIFKNKMEVLSYNISDKKTIWKVIDTIRIPPDVEIQFKSLEPELFQRKLKGSDSLINNNFYNNNNSPEIIFSSGGQLTPFRLNISHPDEAAGYIISGKYSGEISMEILTK